MKTLALILAALALALSAGALVVSLTHSGPMGPPGSRGPAGSPGSDTGAQRLTTCPDGKPDLFKISDLKVRGISCHVALHAAKIDPNTGDAGALGIICATAGKDALYIYTRCAGPVAEFSYRQPLGTD
jgi:hypothetical protein